MNDKDRLAILQDNFKSDWNDNLAEFKAKLKEAAAGIKAWLLIRKPVFEMWAREGGEGLSAFVIAVLQGEAGREKAMALNTGSDATTKVGFNVGLIERDAFWVVIQAVMAGGKIPGWIIPIIAEILKQVKGGK